MSTIVITGGTGLIGTALTKELIKKGHDVIILTRSPGNYSNNTPGLSYAKWDVEKQAIDSDAIAKSDYIIHLAGAGVSDKRWTQQRKKEIVESRTRSSALLVNTLKGTANGVKAVLSASAIGWYGEQVGKNPFVETDPAAEDFLGTTCAAWETSIDPVTALGKRLIKFRTGIVVSNSGGAIKEFKKPLRFGLATILGRGNQMVSWIHIDDLVRLYVYAIEHERMRGIYNAVAPLPITNKKLVLQLAKCTRGRFYVPMYVPAFVLKLVLGEMSIEVLKSANVSCEKLKKEGHSFLHPSFLSACKALPH